MALTVEVDGVVIADRFGVGGQQIHNAAGTGSFALLNDDPQIGLCAVGATVVERLDGTPINEWTITRVEPVAVDPDDDDANLATTFAGDGYTLADAVVFPGAGVHTITSGPLEGLTISSKPFGDDRYLGWMERDYDDSSWGAAVQALVPSGDFRPVGFPDSSAWWIWDSALSGGAHPVGTKLFRRTFTPLSPVVFAVKIVMAGLDSYEAYLDGTLIAKTDPAIDTDAGTKARAITVEINGDRPHTLAIRVDHVSASAGGCLCTVYEHETANVLTRTDSSWKVVDLSAEPGMTPGSVMRQLASEAAGRDVLVDTTFTFGDSLDSRGEPWPTIVGDFTVRVLDGLDDVTDQLAEGWWDWWFAPGAGRAMSAVTADGVQRPGGTGTGRGQTRSVTFAEGVNCTELSYVETDVVKNAALARWADGFIYEEITDSVASHGRRETGLALSNVQSGPSTLWTMLATLQPVSSPEVSIVVGIEPANEADTPFLAFGIGDRVTAPARDGTPTEYRVMAISWDEDDDGYIAWTVELATARDVQEQIWQRWLRRTGNGTLDGRSRSATVTSPSVLSAGVVTPVEITWSTGSGELLIGDRGSPYRPREQLIVYRLDAEADVAGATGPSAVRLYDGITPGPTVQLNVGADSGHIDLAAPFLVDTLDTLNVEGVLEGGHTGVSVTAYGFPTQ